MTKNTVAPKDRPRAARSQNHSQSERDDDDGDGHDEPIDPTTAFEDLRHDLADVEALAVAAEGALESLPPGTTRDQRRGIGRLYALVEATASAASAALDQADEKLACISGNAPPQTVAVRGPAPKRSCS